MKLEVLFGSDVPETFPIYVHFCEGLWRKPSQWTRWRRCWTSCRRWCVGRWRWSSSTQPTPMCCCLGSFSPRRKSFTYDYRVISRSWKTGGLSRNCLSDIYRQTDIQCCEKIFAPLPDPDFFNMFQIIKQIVILDKDNLDNYKMYCRSYLPQLGSVFITKQ